MLGLQTAVHLAQLTLVDTGLMTWTDLGRVMSTAPASIAGDVDAVGPVVPGSVANLTLIDPHATTTLTPADLASLSANTPWLGRELPGRVVATILRGRPTVLDGRAQA